MVYYIKCEKWIKALLCSVPFMLFFLNFLVLNHSIEESLFIYGICIMISLFLLKAILSTKYIIEKESLLIKSIFKKEIIYFRDIESIAIKKGTYSMETPAALQLWVIKFNKSIIRLAPKDIEYFEKSLNKKLSVRK